MSKLLAKAAEQGSQPATPKAQEPPPEFQDPLTLDHIALTILQSFKGNFPLSYLSSGGFGDTFTSTLLAKYAMDPEVSCGRRCNVDVLQTTTVNVARMNPARPMLFAFDLVQIRTVQRVVKC